jgi:hypothetical protein
VSNGPGVHDHQPRPFGLYVRLGFTGDEDPAKRLRDSGANLDTKSMSRWSNGSSPICRAVITAAPGAQKVRNLRASPRVMVAVGAPTPSFDVELIEAVAELEPPATERLPETFERKYAALMARAGITAERFAATYSQPIRIKPTRWLDWGGAGWQQADAVLARPVGIAVTPA